MMKVSIITIVYNDIDGLKRTVDSVHKQTSREYEYIVIDGGSTDGTVEVIKSNEDIITYWESKRDGGPFFGMNNGLEYVTGDYCIFMNSGDSFYDEHVIEEFLKFSPTLDIYTGIAAEHLGDTIKPWYPAAESDFCLRWFYRHALSHQSSFIKTSLMKEMKYDTEFRIVSDWLFFMIALLNHNATYHPLPFFVSHYMDGGISRDAERAFAERDKAIEKYYGLRILRDCKTMQFGVNEWDALAKRVDPKSKVGKFVFFITAVLIKLRKNIYLTRNNHKC